MEDDDIGGGGGCIIAGGLMLGAIGGKFPCDKLDSLPSPVSRRLLTISIGISSVRSRFKLTVGETDRAGAPFAVFSA
jgi:hypothetical protein